MQSPALGVMGAASLWGPCTWGNGGCLFVGALPSGQWGLALCGSPALGAILGGLRGLIATGASLLQRGRGSRGFVEGGQGQGERGRAGRCGSYLGLALVQALQKQPLSQGLSCAVGLGCLAIDGDQGTALA